MAMAIGQCSRASFQRFPTNIRTSQPTYNTISQAMNSLGNNRGWVVRDERVGGTVESLKRTENVSPKQAHLLLGRSTLRNFIMLSGLDSRRTAWPEDHSKPAKVFGSFQEDLDDHRQWNT